MGLPLKIILKNISIINVFFRIRNLIVKIPTPIRISFLISGLLLSSFQVVAADTPIKVDSHGEQLRVGAVSFPVWRYTITSVDNDVTIKSLELNRGNCVISTADRGRNVNKRLGFGQSYSFTSPTNQSFSQCRPLELVVGTNKGSFTFKW